MPTTIDKERLKELASDPEQTSESIRAALGVSDLYYEFKKDPALKTIFEEARTAARAAGGRLRGRKQTTKASAKKRSTPPRNGNAKGGVSNELLRKLILEFSHVDVYGRPSEHFNEIREELGAVLLVS
jgi:hypothetical protein